MLKPLTRGAYKNGKNKVGNILMSGRVLSNNDGILVKNKRKKGFTRGQGSCNTKWPCTKVAVG